MKKIAVLLILILAISLLVGCEEEKYTCGCPECVANNIECIKTCEFESDGRCQCKGCPRYTGEETYDDVRVITKEKSLVKNSTHVNMKVERPEIEGLKDLILQQTINKEISDAITPYWDEINNLSEGFAYDNSDNMINLKSYKYNVSYKVYRLDDYLSIVVYHDIRTGNNAGVYDDPDKTDGLRSSQWKETYVLDVENCKRLQFADVCDITNCKYIVKEEINKQAKERGIDIVMGNGIVEIPDNQRFYIDDSSKKLVIYFEPGTIAKYNAGELLFEMPFKYNESTKKFKQ